MSPVAVEQQSKRFIHPLTLLTHHAQTALASLGRLFRNPFGSLMTIAVIGIALALPAGLHLMLGNFKIMSNHWDGSTSLSLFLKKEAPESGIQRLADRIKTMPLVDEVEMISRTQALEEFRRFSGFDEVLGLLQDNPLPAVILVKPNEQQANEQTIDELAATLKKEGLIDHVQIDLQWVKRFAAMTDIARRAVLILAGLLSLAVLLIIGNTIRLEIQNRRDEIVITKLIGGTNAFIRRPFLYSGFWYGLLGGISALLLIIAASLMLHDPIARLSLLYDSGFSLQALNLVTVSALLIGSPLLGLFGAGVTVGHHLKQIEPD